MMHLNAVTEKITAFVQEHFPLARRRNIAEDDPLLEKGIVDSLGVLDLVTFLEHEFSINVTDDELIPQNFHTINRLAAFVQGKTNGASR